MSAGFYKRRRGILEHLESGTISLLDLAIHDYLNLKANLVVGSPCSLPPGVAITSAAAIHATAPRQISLRAIQRSLKHLKKIGWLKTWETPGKHGNYPVLVCRGSVHDLSGNEYRVSGEKTTDWRHPVLVRVAEQSQSAFFAAHLLSPDREVRVEKREKRKKQNPAAKNTPPADPRFQPFVDFAYKTFEGKHGNKPCWRGKDFEQLRLLLKSNSSLRADEIERRWKNYLASTEPFTLKQAHSLGYFASNCDKFAEGPVLATPQKVNRNGKPTLGDNARITIAAIQAAEQKFPA